MKNDSGDKLVRDKVQSLDTLSGGIVFGKEEAWDKLQARMDHKPAKKIAIRYWLAAAAVLLLFVCATTAYFYPAEQVTNVVANQQVKAPVNNAIIQEQQAPDVVTQPGKMAVHTTSRFIHKEGKQRKLVINAAAIQPVFIAVPDIPTALDENKKVIVAVNITAPVTPVAKPMKVVQINDIENGNALQTMAQRVSAGPSVAINKLPVVHINDVEREAVQVKTILHENRMSYGRIPFHRPAYNYDAEISNTEEYNQPLNFLKRKLNIQN